VPACQNFLRDLLKEASKSQEVTEDQLIEYTDTMVAPLPAPALPPQLQVFDSNKDGKLQLSEMAKWVPGAAPNPQAAPRPGKLPQ
jgi:Ca2+-binding EF-hand superfamily protein